MNLKNRITKLHYDKNAKGLFVDMLDFFSLFYGFVSRTRNLLYDNGILKQVKIDAKQPNVLILSTGKISLKEKADYIKEKLEALI